MKSPGPLDTCPPVPSAHGLTALTLRATDVAPSALQTMAKATDPSDENRPFQDADPASGVEP